MNALCSILKFLLLFFSALLLLMVAGCGPSKKMTDEKVTIQRIKDSTVYRERIKLDTFRVPVQTANIAIPFKLLQDSILSRIQQSNGRATVTIYRLHDTLYAEAKCDSLEKVIASKDRELSNWHDYALQQSSKEVKVVVTYPWYIKAALWAAVLYIAISIGKYIIHFFKTKSWQKLLNPKQ